MSEYYTPISNLQTFIGISVGVGVLTLVGYYYGPPKKSKQGQAGSPNSMSGGPHTHNQRGMEDDVDAMSDYPLQHMEAILTKSLQEMNVFIKQKKFTEANKHATNCVHFANSTWGKNSIQYAMTMLAVSRLYESQFQESGRDEYHSLLIDSLKESAKAFSQIDEQVIMDTGVMVYDKLVSILTRAGRHDEAEDWAVESYKARKSMLTTAGRSPGPHIEHFCNSAASAGIVFSHTGKFRQAELYFKEALEWFCKFDPLNENAWNTLEYFTNTLHQQAKTQDALNELYNYKKQIENIEESTSFITKIFTRCATLCFIVDRWQDAESALLKACEIEKIADNLNPQTLCDLDCLYWEMDQPEKAREIEKQIKSIFRPSPEGMPHARSSLLYTVDSLLIGGIYVLQLRINRKLPHRKEGEKSENTDSIPRRIERCFLVIQFETNNAEPLEMSQEVNSYQFELTSPKVEVDFNKWYMVDMDIYEDHTKTKKLGSHHQPVYSAPSLNFAFPK